MNHPLHRYLAGQLDGVLQKHRVVVFYDARSEFEPFFEELEVVGTGLGDLPRVGVGDTLPHLARFDGSFFALKASIEPLVSADSPETLLVYIPGQARDRTGSVLMEVERAGHVYGDAPGHRLKSVARRLLRRQYTDGDIDEMLRPETLGYRDVVRFLGQEGSGGGSLLKLVLSGSTSEALVVDWLVSEDKDQELAAKLAEPELFRLVHARLGLQIDEGTSLSKARHQTVRYLLINEFRSDLDCEAPASLQVVAAPSQKEEAKHIADVTGALRSSHGTRYVDWADTVEREFNLDNADIDPSTLGAIDTFRFEERRLLHHAADFVAAGQHTEALALVAGRGHSFWVDHPGFFDRLAQWEACRFMAELGGEIDRVAPALAKTAAAADAWIAAYSAEDGWHRVDRAHRNLEAWIASMEDDPEEPLERALAVIRASYDGLLKDMATGFTTALTASGWTTSETLRQTSIYPKLVEPCGGRVAYFFVDAMRFEMGTALVEQLTGAEELRLQPAAAVLPSVTPLGMAALLPGASSSFSAVEHEGKLAAKIGGSVLTSFRDRLNALKAVRPDATEILLDNLLIWSAKKVATRLGDSPLMIVRSQEIDALGEAGLALAARQAMESIIGNIARAVRKLAKAGIEQFVITSDHGHQFSLRKDDHMIMDRPGGNQVDQHRRCWAGHGGQTPSAAVRVSGAELGYQTDLDFVFPRGLGVFRSGGDLAFHHGGCSLQEMIIPAITLRMPAAEPLITTEASVIVEGCPTKLTNRTFGCRITFAGDMFQPDPIAARVVLVGDGQEVGRAGMAPDAEFDRATSTVQLPPNKPVNLGMILTNEAIKTFRVVAQDPATDAVLAQSDEIEVGELI